MNLFTAKKYICIIFIYIIYTCKYNVYTVLGHAFSNKQE